MRWLRKRRFRFLQGQKGFSLIEILIALGILGIIAVAFLNGLSTASKAVMMSQESVIAESLAKSQVEHIKAQDYIPVADYDPATNCYEKIDIPVDLVGKYEIEIMPPEIVTLAGRAGFELQSITTKVKRHERVKLTITFYRVGLALL